MATSVEHIKVLNVVEKPSVAKMLVRILSNQDVKELNQSYTFDYQIVDDGTDAGTVFQMVVTSVKGHLKDMTFLSNVRSFKSYELIELFDVNVDKVPKLESQKSTIGHLRRVVEVCKRLYLLLYCDLEGESIAKEVVEVCQEVNSDLLIRSARFSSLHKSDIKAAFRDAGQINHRFSDAADFRREINLRSGYVFTRFQTSLLSNAYKIHNVLSYGMCQLPTLGFIVEQCEERKNQVWKIKCTHKIVDDTSSLDGR